MTHHLSRKMDSHSGASFPSHTPFSLAYVPNHPPIPDLPPRLPPSPPFPSLSSNSYLSGPCRLYCSPYPPQAGRKGSGSPGRGGSPLKTLTRAGEAGSLPPPPTAASPPRSVAVRFEAPSPLPNVPRSPTDLPRGPRPGRGGRGCGPAGIPCLRGGGGCGRK